MRQADVKVGGTYRAKVSGAMVNVRVDATRKQARYKGQTRTVFDCTNLATGKKLAGWSAAKFRYEVVERKRTPTIGHAEPPKNVAEGLTDQSDADARTAHDEQVNDETGHEGQQRSDPTSGLATSAAATTPTASANGGTGATQRPRPSAPTSGSATGSNGAANDRDAAIRNWSIGGMPAVKPEKPAAPVRGQAPHIECPALAGTGKTTMCVKGLVWALGGNPKITPSPQQQAVWDALKAGELRSVRLSSFSNTITDELKRRCEAEGLDKKGVQARGIHSLGNGAVFKALGKLDIDDKGTLIQDITAALLGSDRFKLRKEPGMSVTLKAVDDLVGLCKQTLTDPTPEALDRLTSRYDVELGEQRSTVYDLIPRVLEECLRPKGRMNFDDMIWLPIKLGLPIFRVDTQIVDESQDLNRMQQELMYRAGYRILFVGDKHQAIFGFAGADAESMDRMRSTLGASQRGIVSLPLTVTRRCPKAVVREARRYVPEYEAHPDNPEGRVLEQLYPIQGMYERKREIPWAESYGPHVKPGDLVVCRCNAPIVRECFRFVRQDIPVVILGRKIGDGLVSLVERMNADTIPQLVGRLDEWYNTEVAKEQAKQEPSETKLEQLLDKKEVLTLFIDRSDSVPKVVQEIQRRFTDNPDSQAVRMSSIHKAKGLEAQNVHWLRPAGVGPRRDKMQEWEIEQELNLEYVATTRPIGSLTYVD